MSKLEMKRLIMEEWRRLRSEHAELLGVSIRFSRRMTSTMGSCRFKRQPHGQPAKCFEVVISESLLACGLEQVIDTLRHEAAHAVAGLEAKHGPVWKATARRLGATPKACGTLTAEQREARRAVQGPAKYTVRCSRCGIEHDQRRMTSRRRYQYDAGHLRHAAGCGGLLTVHTNY